MVQAQQLVVVTDLDGTLLDHHTYSYKPAVPALNALAELGIPVVLNSSKTRAEIRTLREQLSNRHPFIVENGAATFWESGYFPADGDSGNLQTYSAGLPRRQIVDALNELRKTRGYRFEGFSDWTEQQIATITGLDLESASRAAQREFSEPLLWEDTQERRKEFLQQLTERGLQGLQGGRFLSISGQYDKSSSLAFLRQQYEALNGLPCTIVALGDSPNDIAMLDHAEIAVIISSPKSDQIVLTGPDRIIKTSQPGPDGWNAAIQEILATNLTGE